MNYKKKREYHGHAHQGRHSPTYISWCLMRQRCFNRNHPKYPRYGGRGINICNRWKKSFIAFLKDMGLRPKGKSIHRINNDKDYKKRNCKWATPKEQMSNKNTGLVNVLHKVFGQLTVIGRVPPIPPGRFGLWLCRCTCGNTVRVQGYDLLAGKQVTCGCKINRRKR